ncbi:unnamed protein product [Effrenium voratum]|uniref:ABC1 atypical kinase-like domain-containing protein n=1 Tax=Effrenium voratum TaxID=2562239 RepID=A0AA36MNV6_9DINO|nr:unnamed protein product [Effrenium voratum]
MLKDLHSVGMLMCSVALAGTASDASLSSLLAARLRQRVPLAMLLARWVAVSRPDLALAAPRLVAMLREEAGSRPSSRARVSAEELHEQLAAAFGRDWPEALLLDLLPKGADPVFEIFRAVLREDELVKLQERSREASTRKPNGKLAKVAEAAGARSAAVWARHPGMELCAEADLLLASMGLRLLARLGLVSTGAEETFQSFADFARGQLDLRTEAWFRQQLRAALGPPAPCISVPRSIGRASAEVALVTWEDGICLSEVCRRPFGAYVEDSEIAARRNAARKLARTFWELLFQRSLVLGGLCTGNVLLRTAMEDEDQLEVVLLRCGLCHQVDADTQQDLLDLARALREPSPAPEIGRLILTRVHLRAGGCEDEVREFDGFVQGIEGFLGGKHPGQMRGALLLHRFLDCLRRHRLRISPAQLRVATSLAAAHTVCSSMDPFSNGGLLEALNEVAKLREGQCLRRGDIRNTVDASADELVRGVEAQVSQEEMSDMAVPKTPPKAASAEHGHAARSFRQSVEDNLASARALFQTGKTTAREAPQPWPRRMVPPKASLAQQAAQKVQAQAIPKKEELVPRIKKLQRDDKAAAAKWAAYCDVMRTGLHDPARHTARTLHAFLEAYERGEVPKLIYSPVVRLRGVPFQSELNDVVVFLRDYGVAHNQITIGFNAEGKKTGEAFVTLPSVEMAERVLQEKQNKLIDDRYIEVFRSSEENRAEAQALAAKSGSHPAQGTGLTPHPPKSPPVGLPKPGGPLQQWPRSTPHTVPHASSASAPAVPPAAPAVPPAAPAVPPAVVPPKVNPPPPPQAPKTVPPKAAPKPVPLPNPQPAPKPAPKLQPAPKSAQPKEKLQPKAQPPKPKPQPPSQPPPAVKAQPKPAAPKPQPAAPKLKPQPPAQPPKQPPAPKPQPAQPKPKLPLPPAAKARPAPAKVAPKASERERSRSPRTRPAEASNAAKAAASADPAAEGSGEGAVKKEQEAELDGLDRWLRSLDGPGVMLKYSAALHREFSDLSELSAVVVDPSAKGLKLVEPSVWEALGIETLGHKLYFCNGLKKLT